MSDGSDSFVGGAFRATAILTTVVFLKAVVGNLGMGGARLQNGTRAPEDTYQRQTSAQRRAAKVNDDGSGDYDSDDDDDDSDSIASTDTEVAAARQDAEDRSRRIVGNDLENIPYGLVLAWAALLSILLGSEPAVRERQALAHVVLCALFVVARVAHTVVFTLRLSYARSGFFFLALLAAVGMAANLCVAAFFVPAGGFSADTLLLAAPSSPPPPPPPSN